VVLVLVEAAAVAVTIVGMTLRMWRLSHRTFRGAPRI